MIEYILYGSLGFLGFIAVVLIILILTQKRRHVRYESKVQKARNYLFSHYVDGEDVPMPVSKKFFFSALIDVDEQIHLDQPVRTAIIHDIKDSRFIKKYTKNLNAIRAYKRKIAIYYIGRLRTNEAYEILYARFLKEKNEAVKLHIVAQMRYGLDETKTKAIIDSLVGSSEHYHKRLCTLLGTNYKRIHTAAMLYEEDTRYDIVLGLSRLGAYHSDAFLVNYMTNTLQWVCKESTYDETRKYRLVETICENILNHQPDILRGDEYLFSSNVRVQHYALLALAKNQDSDSLETLIRTVDNTSLDKTRVQAISEIVLENPSLIDVLIKRYKVSSPHKKDVILEVLKERLDYIILSLYSRNEDLLKVIIKKLMAKEINEPIIDFLNQNKEKTIEVFLLSVVQEALSDNPKLINEFRQYLAVDLLKALSLSPMKPEESIKEKIPLEKKKIYWMLRWMFVAIIVFPIIFIVRMNRLLLTMDARSIFDAFLIDVNRYLIVYFVSINTVYIILLLFAFVGSKRQVNLAKTKKSSLLFQDKLLPGISIIAPAYNEVVSIKESVTSLLNLNYPNYEVIVVNDGSKDDTLNVMIEHFNLERIHSDHEAPINTKKIRGVYKTKDIPNLIVVDKQNGGKADALNVGINVSKQAFVCGIDADSILESDALLKLASAMLDDTAPFVAMGGNIYPANGFTFDKGYVEARGIPKEVVTRLQTIEYLRAFTSGRIGWSALRSLMIISGAFGLFHKEALIEAGGYLTSSSALKKDTVGEDMELVVRMTKQALEKKEPYRVAYVYNAYCYTELPSDMITLLKQRNRWQRGLIDILSYHKKLAFNPRYKQIGFLGYPYYFIFEFLGPFFELQGYIILAIALFLGLLSPMIILGIFTASIGFGVIVSLASLFMTEREILMMNKKETLILILYAIFENFGYRQIISLHRVWSTFSALKESGSWGAQKRKGFKS